jgi:hypothetical protein
VSRLIGAFVIAAALPFGNAAVAGPEPVAAVPDLTDAVEGMTGKTWRDLLVQLFPDIAAPPASSNAVATATEMNDLRSIGVADESWNRCPDTIDVGGFDAQQVRFGDQRRWIVTIAMPDECAVPIALFDEQGKLVDAVNVRGDVHASLEAFYSLGPAGALGVAWNWHDNSDQSYDDPMLVFATPDGLSAIDNLPAFGSHSCRVQFTEDPVIRIKPGVPMARIEGKIIRRTQKFAADCETKIGREIVVTFDGSWRWNAKKSAYEPHTRELDLLANWNKKQF